MWRGRPDRCIIKDRKRRAGRLGEDMLKEIFENMKRNAAAAKEHSRTHCGGCRHDCPLSAPGCGVGKEAAARQKQKDEKRAAKAQQITH